MVFVILLLEALKNDRRMFSKCITSRSFLERLELVRYDGRLLEITLSWAT